MIARDPAAAAASSHDLAIVGGGIYGAALALEAAGRGIRTVLVERDDFGGATSWNSLRIVHGGLRYLQTLDLARFRESVAERRWFVRRFPTLVRPLACLMPLYARGLKRPSVFRAAMLANDTLSSRRNAGVVPEGRLAGGRVLGPAAVRARFPRVDTRGLRGGALWHDAAMPDSQRVLVEVLRGAAAGGALALNRVEAEGLLVAGGRVEGLACRDRVTGRTLELRAPLVVNAAGPWSRRFAATGSGRDDPALFRPSLAFNVLLDRPPLAAEALAVQPRRSGAPIYFLHPWKGKVLAGTVHAPWRGDVEGAQVPPDLVAAYLADLSDAVPGWEVGPPDVLRVHWGFLPAREEGSARLAVRPEVRDHGAEGGPAGFWSVSGVKFTTARLVAERLLDRIVGRGRVSPGDPPPPAEIPDRARFEDLLARDPASAEALVRRIARDESALTAEDLLLRRTDWGSDPRDQARLAPVVAAWLEPAG